MVYPSSVKAEVMAALLAGQSVAEVAAEYQIPAGTVKSWKSRQNGTPVATVATPKKEEIGELLVVYLATSIQTLTKQLAIFADPEWIRTQSAAELATLHGVVADKSVRLLEALSRTETEASVAGNDS